MGGDDRSGGSPPGGGFDLDLWQSGGGKGAPIPFERTCFAQYWDELPPLVANPPPSVPKDDDDGAHDGASPSPAVQLRVDGHSLRGRMAAYRYLIEHTPAGRRGAKLWGNRLERHFLWGYAALLDWQGRSGRLSTGRPPPPDGASASGDPPPDEISAESWWGYMNFCFSICTLLGAVEAGVLGDGSGAGAVEVEVVLADERSRELVANDLTVKESIVLWRDFWKEGHSKFLRGMHENGVGGGESSAPPRGRMERLYDAMMAQKWKAHTAVFRMALFDATRSAGGFSKELLSRLPDPEQRFAVGFCRIVDLLSALNVRTDLVTTWENGVGYLPLRVIDDRVLKEMHESYVRGMSDIEKKRMRTIRNMHQLHDASSDALKSMVAFWGRVGRWRWARQNISQILDGLTHGGIAQKTVESAKVLFFFILPASATELAVWASAGTALCISLKRRRA